MTYPSDFEAKIGFLPLRSILKEYCTFRKGCECVDAMAFSSDFKEVRRKLTQTAEMQSLLASGNPVPDDTLLDVGPSLLEIKAEGSFMPADRMLKLARMMETFATLRNFIISLEGKAPELTAEFAELSLFPELIREINRIINKFGEVSDNASPELARIRDSIRSLQASVATIVRRFISMAAAEGIVDKDAQPAIRDGRPVVPVASMMKRKVNGIVHDQSATGKTVFIEPAEAVEAGNRLRELEAEEQHEVARILTALTSLIRPEIPAIEGALDKMGVYDFIRAKARFAIEVDAQMCHLQKRPAIEWYKAVHPVLLLALRKQGREVVPLDLTLTPEQRILIISGPNAGGKSVCLKTVGCVQYMTQCGLLPTLRDNSHIGFFRNIFIDIGDEQSFENDLSTYSSHLRNMKFFLRNADSDTLLLADEMGSGTEPQIGGALAQSILATLGEAGCFGIVTTHYQNLKTFARDTAGFVNGAMLYDRQHLRPTFQLAVGNPGSSFAIEIARNIGLPAEVIDRAKDIVGSDYVNLDKYLLDIARDRRYWANKRLSIKEQERRISRIEEDYEQKAETLRTSRAEILREAREQAREILSGANAKLENTIHEIRKAEAERERTKELRRELDAYRKELEKEPAEGELPAKLRASVSRRPKAKKVSAVSVASENVAVGDNVKMEGGGVAGKVLAIKEKKAEVAFGSIRTWVDISRLRKTGAPKPAVSAPGSFTRSTQEDIRRRQLSFNTELDVRGMRADEALQAVTYFIDDAVQFSVGRVRILHGTGTGALRQAIRAYLKSVGGVVSFADEDVRFGGAGITVVNLA